MEKKGMLHSMNQPKKTSSSFPMSAVMGVIIGALVLGILGGFVASKFSATSSLVSSKNVGKAGDVAADGKSAGIKDADTFKDRAEGMLKEGGLEGEGNFHIEQKPNQPDQNVYLTSTAVDLTPFVGKKVKVWGQTFQGDKAGWLMDVGYIEVAE